MTQERPLLVCGSGRCLFSDIQALAFDERFAPTSFADIGEHYDIMAINDAYLALDVVHHLVSYHDEIIWPLLMLKGPRLLDKGEYVVRIDGLTCHSQRPDKGVDRVWIFDEGGGSSSLFGVQIGLELGYRRIILAGVPFDASGRFYFPPWKNGHDYAGSDGWETWELLKANGTLKNVRSMSGRTRQLLGAPEREWIWQ
jgi:hypothetical protein